MAEAVVAADASESQHAGNELEDESQTVAVEFNLSNADQLAQQLEKVDLTEEESEELLKEAYRINKQLKMILKKQEKAAKSSKPTRIQSAESSQAKSASHKVLPPINNRTGVPAKSERAYKSSSKPAAQSSKPRAKSAKARPQWDDRFSYS